MAIAAEAIHGASSIPSGHSTPKHTQIDSNMSHVMADIHDWMITVTSWLREKLKLVRTFVC